MVSVSVSKNSKILVSEKVLVSVSKKIGLEKSFGFGFLFGENKENKKFDVMTYLVDRKICVYEGSQFL